MYKNLKIHFALSERMATSFQSSYSNKINSTFHSRFKLIELPDPSSYVGEFDEEVVQHEIEKLGGTGNVLVMIDYDNICFKDANSTERILSRIDLYLKKLYNARCEIARIVCMNQNSHKNFSSKVSLMNVYANHGFKRKSNYFDKQ
jgi:hypothetical protein